ncbi:STARP antigen [Plasmodium yoelii yoelii]|uniref:GRAM domain-containing protein n=2 Tax=Plasmodium yoelii yoelii TaxID=73239 RepID=A0AAE9WS44_PLAYO|nr:STARP antigen [Plasmodium yoelii yoelii]WBY58990.1 hypothetical protein Py17XNL_001204889 [Plasmodium yoelii yoelii]
MTTLKELIPFHDFITEVEKSPVFSNSLRNSELILDDNDESLGLHKIFEINIKGDDNKNIKIEMNEEPDQSIAKPNDDETLSDDIHNPNINQEIINYIYEHLLPKEANNQTLFNNFDTNDKVEQNLRTTSKNEELDDTDENASPSTSMEEIHERNCTIIKKDEDKFSLQSHVLVEGKCFISNDRIYFVSAFSQILKNSSVVRVKCESILSTIKAKKFNIIPKSLKIKPDETQSFSFTILLDKDNTYDSISNMIQYPINSKQKLEINPIPHNKKQTQSQNNNLDLDHIKPSPVFSENLLITKEIHNMISMNIYPEEIQLLEEKEFYTDLKYVTSLYINKYFKDLYYNVFSKNHPKNPLYELSRQMDPQGINYDKFNQLPDTIQTPSGYTFNFKYNASLEKVKQKLYASFMLPSRADINETIKLFFFHNCIILQTQANFVTKIPFLNSFRFVITALIHDLPSENYSEKNTTQIDILYDAHFFKHTYFENKIVATLLKLLESISLKFKVRINECIREIYKDKSFRETTAQITNINNIFRTSTTTDNSTTDNNIIDNSTTDNITTDNNTTDNITTDNSTTDNNIIDNSTTDNNIIDNSTTDNNTTDDNTTDNSTTDNNTTDNNTGDNNTTDNITTDNITTDNNTTDNITTDNNTTDDNTTDNNTTDDNTTDDSTTDNNTTDDNTTDNNTTDNNTTDNITTDNSTTDDNTTDNNTTDNITTDNNTADNNTADNNTTDNNTTDNITTDNNTTDNNTTDDNTTDDNTTDNITTDNNTTDNNTTDNSTTDNNTTDNNTTDNSTTDDNATDNITTDKITTDNSTTDDNATDNITTDNSTTDDNTIDNITTDNSSCITNNQKYNHTDAKNKTLAGFKNKITNPQNNKIVIKTKHFENILPNYINDEIHINPTLAPSDKSN